MRLCSDSLAKTKLNEQEGKKEANQWQKYPPDDASRKNSNYTNTTSARTKKK